MSKSKNDINKEAMFSKIMPSGSASHTVAPQVRLTEPNNPFTDDRDKKATELEEERENAKEKEDRPNEKSDKKSNEKTDSTDSPMKKNIQTIMVNIRERMVMDRLDEALEKFNCCTCFFCRQDVTCMALNSLQPKYIVTTEEDIDKIIENEDSSEVTQAIMKAILHVKTHPRH